MSGKAKVYGQKGQSPFPVVVGPGPCRYWVWAASLHPARELLGKVLLVKVFQDRGFSEAMASPRS